MSYDIWLEADLGGPEPVSVAASWNYTSNCAPMWRTAGADLAGFDGKSAGDCAPVLRAAIAKMRADPDTYKAMNPSNGWGSYEELLPALVDLAAAFERAPAAIVRVER